VTRLEVWAPAAQSVDAIVPAGRRAMRSGPEGRFAVDVDLQPEDRYAFSLDGGPARPDPRSRRQPEGPEGPSAVVDPSAFPWTDDDWNGVDLTTSVIYELHVGTFSEAGTFDGAITHLDHLVDLGVGAVEVMPIAAYPGRWGWGYDGVALFAPHEPYGGPDGFCRFVDACHNRGLGVLLDVVYNHLGPAGNHLAEFGPYFTSRHRTPWGDAVNFDGPGCAEPRRFVVDNARQWLRDHHVDGLRLDAVHAIVDTSAVHILAELSSAVAALAEDLGRRLWLIAESNLRDPRLVRPIERGGYGLDAMWFDDFHHAMHVTLTGESQGYYRDFAGTDVDEVVARGVPGAPPERLVAFVQNHDQIGNRARGERLAHLAGHDAAAGAARTLLRAPFVPLVFMGEEWAASSPFQYFTDHGDDELARQVREGRRQEFAAFGWRPEQVPDPQDPRTFERSRLRWDELDQADHERMLAHYRSLIAARTTPS
jgi:maltooligosyltrehalose trehalohydrolase